MAKVSIALQHPFLMTIIPALIGLGGTLYLANKNEPGIDDAEKIYWTSIQPPNDSAEKYCAYLKKYPKGHFVDLAENQCPSAVEAKERAAELAEQKAAEAKAQAEEAEAKAAELAEQKAVEAKAQAEAAEEKAQAEAAAKEATSQ
jgi:hypothetical protein